jgi:site-specific recombinase XerD
LWKGWHAYRRGLATNLHELGVPDKVMQAILRHEDVSRSQGSYIKTVPPVVTDAINQLEARIARAAIVRQVSMN